MKSLVTNGIVRISEDPEHPVRRYEYGVVPDNDEVLSAAVVISDPNTGEVIKRSILLNPSA